MVPQIELRPQAFDALGEAGRRQAALALEGKAGALSLFVGKMRDFNEGREVRELFLEHYPGMTEKHLAKLCQQAEQRWSVLDILVLHRTGRVEPGEDIVLVGVWAAHRGDAMDAARFILEDLKRQAPFWKKEAGADGAQWVERNTSGYAA